jgi:hypothetical protein
MKIPIRLLNIITEQCNHVQGEHRSRAQGERRCFSSSPLEGISDERVRVQMIGQAEGMQFIIKVHMNEISWCESL